MCVCVCVCVCVNEIQTDKQRQLKRERSDQSCLEQNASELNRYLNAKLIHMRRPFRRSAANHNVKRHGQQRSAAVGKNDNSLSA